MVLNRKRSRHDQVCAFRALDMKKIKVVLVDDHNIVRQSLARVLSQEFDIEVVGQWGSPFPLFDFLKTGRCDVVIMDLKMPGMNGIEAAKQILELSPQTKVIVLSAYSDDRDIFQSIQAGVMGYLPKETTMEELVDAIRTVHRGNAVLDPIVTKKVIDRFSGVRETKELKEELTTLEIQILRLSSSGLSTKEIADRLKLKFATVKFHFREIYRKLDAKDRTNAVAEAIKRGIIS